jgi:hypothetical protein
MCTHLGALSRVQALVHAQSCLYILNTVLRINIFIIFYLLEYILKSGLEINIYLPIFVVNLHVMHMPCFVLDVFIYIYIYIYIYMYICIWLW